MGVLKLLRRPVRQGPVERGAASCFIGRQSLTFMPLFHVKHGMPMRPAMGMIICCTSVACRHLVFRIQIPWVQPAVRHGSALEGR